MKFATISHLLNKQNINYIPKDWIKKDLIISPELDINGTKGYVIALKLLPKQLLDLPREEIRKKILDAAILAYDELKVELIQLGALTTSVTSGGVWIANQKEYRGYVNNGDSYTAAVTCQAAIKLIINYDREPADITLAIVGAYGIIGEAVTKLMVPDFKKSILIGRRKNKLEELAKKINGNFETTLELRTKEADIIITATSHPTALIESKHLKKGAMVVDVSQPPNLSYDVCKLRSDVIRVDGGYVDFPKEFPIPIPGLPKGKNFACIAEIIMQAMENEKENHVGSVDLNHLKKTEKWGKIYGFKLNELTNFGKEIGE